MLQEFNQNLKGFVQDKMRDIHTALPGRVDAFYPDRCEADVVPYGKFKKPDGTTMNYPKIAGVPVLFPQGAGQAIAIVWAIKPGDECLLLFAEQTLETWQANAESSTDLPFDLQNCIAIPGLYAKRNPLVREACDNDALIISSAGQKITLTTGAVTIDADSIVLRSAGTVDITAPGGVNITGDMNTTGTHTDANGVHS